MRVRTYQLADASIGNLFTSLMEFHLDAKNINMVHKKRARSSKLTKRRANIRGYQCHHFLNSGPLTKALFTWRRGAPANRATRLGGLKHSLPLHASHLSEIVERPLITTNKMAYKRNVLAQVHFFLSLVPLRPLLSI